MPFTRRWLLEDRVLFLQFTDTISLKDIADIAETHETWLTCSETTHMIHYIIDLRHVENYPRDILKIKVNLQTKMARTDWILFVSEDYFLSHIGGVFGRILNYRYKQCESVRNAYRFLQEIEEMPIPQNWLDNLEDTMPRR